MVKVSKTLNNIDIGNTQECNLLCKLIIDYIPSKKVILEQKYNEDDTSIYSSLNMEEGNFINFQDTSYLATKCLFFQPSRHMIDGERFDFEINIYHGQFDKDMGYSTHLHYHNDIDDNLMEKKTHNHLHYHKKNDTNDHTALEDRAKKNVVLCLLFNRDTHKGTDVNVFFDQFIHSNKFKEFNNDILKESEFGKEYNDKLADLETKKNNADADKTNIDIINNILDPLKGKMNELIAEYKNDVLIENPDTILNLNGVDTEITNLEGVTELKNEDIKSYVNNIIRLLKNYNYNTQTVEIKALLTAINLAIEEEDKNTEITEFDNYRKTHKDKIITSLNKIIGEINKKDTIYKIPENNLNEFIKRGGKKTIMENQNLKNNYTIDIHNYYNFNNLLPKRRSFFQYDERKEDKTVLVFDMVQSIEKSIIDKFDNIKTPLTSYLEPINTNNVLYKRNIEVITDERYKKLVRLQVKNLLSLNRIIPAVNSGEVAQDYYDRADEIYKDFNYKYNNYHSDVIKAQNLSKKWEEYGKGPPIRISFGDLINKYKNIEKMLPTASDATATDPIKINNPKNINFDFSLKTYLTQFEDIFIKPNLKDYIDKDGDNNKPKNLDEFRKNLFIYGIEKVIPTYEEKYNFYREKFKYIYPENIKEEFKIYKYFIGLNENNLYDYVNYDIFSYYSYYEFVSGKDITELLKELNDYSTTPSGSDTPYSNDIINTIISKEPSAVANEEKLDKTIEEGDSGKLYYIKKTHSKNEVLKEILTFLKQKVSNNPRVKDFMFLINPDNKGLSKTIDGDECQAWQSNEVHYQGDTFNPLAKTVLFESAKWDDMTGEQRRLLKDGLIKIDDTDPTKRGTDKIEEYLKELDGKTTTDIDTLKNDLKGIKFTTHNQCRNPGNLMPGPWCYTRNPNVRWQYCVKPDYSKMIARITLLVTFIFTIILAFIAVKRIFRGEYFTKFMALVTGTKFGEEGGGVSAPQPPPTK